MIIFASKHILFIKKTCFVSPKGIAVIASVAVVIALVIFLPLKPGDTPPTIDDSIQIDDGAQVGLQVGTEPSTQIKDDASVEFNAENIDVPIIIDNAVIEAGDVKYFVDENGTKHYFIEVVDTPILED